MQAQTSAIPAKAHQIASWGAAEAVVALAWVGAPVS